MTLTEIKKRLDLPQTYKAEGQFKLGIARIDWFISPTEGTQGVIAYSDPYRVLELRKGSFAEVVSEFIQRYDLWTDFSKLDSKQIIKDLTPSEWMTLKNK